MNDLIPHNYKHYQAAHCESGATSNLLKSMGIHLSEAMVFGLGSGLFFAHLPFIKVGGYPLTTYRSFPGNIYQKSTKRLGLKSTVKTFSNINKGEETLHALLDQKIPVGIQVNIYWPSYIPKHFRFQFNAHNAIVLGRNEEGNYLVSDPMLEEPMLCTKRSMRKARFAKGILSPRGKIYYFSAPDNYNIEEKFESAVTKALKETCNRMTRIPIPFFGYKGIHFMGKKIIQLEKNKKSLVQSKRELGNIVRMQEEIGTGGAGFRFLYAAFLQEIAQNNYLPGKRDGILEASCKLTEVGDMWRQFAMMSAQFIKNKYVIQDEKAFIPIGQLVQKIAEIEFQVFKNLDKVIRNG